MEQHLRHLLDELSAAIGRTDDEDHRRELTRLHGEIERRLDVGAAGMDAGGQLVSGPGAGGPGAVSSGPGVDDESDGLVERLETAELRFEADHPSLGASIRQAIQSLTAGGI
ncbi:MAG TPA: hypothetical protein VFE55_00145 [Acidimicrobiia bacterium]|nr:hypothetical protein [Acidimicrobiia bacterium]